MFLFDCGLYQVDNLISPIFFFSFVTGFYMFLKTDRLYISHTHNYESLQDPSYNIIILTFLSCTSGIYKT